MQRRVRRRGEGAGSAAIVGGGLGVDEETNNLGEIGFEGGLESGDGGMDVGHGKVVGKGAVTGNLDPFDGRVAFRGVRAAVDGEAGMGLWAVATLRDGRDKAGHEDVVDVEHARDGGGDTAETQLDLPVAIERGGLLDGRGLTLDVGEDGADLGHIAADVGLELGDEFVRRTKGHVFVDLEMLFEMKEVAVALECDVVNREVYASGDGANTVVNALGLGGGGDGVNDDVGVRKMTLDGARGGGGDLLRTLEGQVARHAKGDIGEEAGTGLADAKTVD